MSTKGVGVSSRSFGTTTRGVDVLAFALWNAELRLEVTEYGATVTSVKYGGEEVTLQHATLAAIEAEPRGFEG
eukprot:CAMPEP_0118901116 /NCGR_PEP_ID=MMETSP1166-20130328/6951_1 /TAXON_ID=1104430 /ORGANISM="Chrysoreinhardia sp, Strain CCMP3193" /LENGTH=72 /DNA_ID=CAMNT_0006840279 /DNA_START=44 /DNA_END=259 /DNA_ORIENTATION=-